MQIKPVPFTNTVQGLPATGYAYHIGLPNEDPIDDDNKLDITDGFEGLPTSNPFYINERGLFINKNGQRINPTITEDRFSIIVLSPAGGILYEEEDFISDVLSEQQRGVVDFTLNNFKAALNTNLTDYDTIYIESFAAGWENTTDGPINGFYAHKDGTTGTPSTGSPSQFYDSVGNGWREDDAQRIGDKDVTPSRLAGIGDAKIYVGDGPDDVVAVDMGGDANIDNTGIVTLTTDSVEESNIIDNNVGLTKLKYGGFRTINDDGTLAPFVLGLNGEITSAGGGTSSFNTAYYSNVTIGRISLGKYVIGGTPLGAVAARRGYAWPQTSTNYATTTAIGANQVQYEIRDVSTDALTDDASLVLLYIR